MERLTMSDYIGTWSLRKLKMIDNTINLDGLFTVILYSEATKGDEGVQYKFRTKTSGTDTCKSPMGMFDEEYIDNDLALVFDEINSYYNE